MVYMYHRILHFIVSLLFDCSILSMLSVSLELIYSAYTVIIIQFMIQFNKY